MRLFNRGRRVNRKFFNHPSAVCMVVCTVDMRRGMIEPPSTSFNVDDAFNREAEACHQRNGSLPSQQGA